MKCPICAQAMERLVNLPRFPLTEKYEPWAEDFEEGRGFADQAFMYCEDCSHGALETVVPDLYGGDYRTSTGKSEGALQAVKRFAEFIARPNVEFVIDIGGNDGSLLSHFAGHTIAIDPHASGARYNILQSIENADLTPFKNVHKVIVSSHTIEHLVDPNVMIEKCAAVMGENDILALQFPSLELLVQDARIDQIHHQHLHYFSERSIKALLFRHGLDCVSSRFDESHWGALMLIAKKRNAALSYGTAIETIDVQNAIRTFHNLEMHIPRGTIALGAALMLPVLAYWFPELDAVEFIADDDPQKNGLRYVNVNKIIKNEYSLRDMDIVITAIGSNQATRALTRKAIDAGARRIILPLHTL